ncbi:uncharacterized protein LOC143712055 [Siphateles boraxobius]|uniref:uncharacterized protein LOC143712055 n=1 Tax=Siphateles boraxobius TaxID=180520 RepID=UPI004062D9A8
MYSSTRQSQIAVTTWWTIWLTVEIPTLKLDAMVLNESPAVIKLGAGQVEVPLKAAVIQAQLLEKIMKFAELGTPPEGLVDPRTHTGYEGPLSSTPMKKRPVLTDLTVRSIGSSDSDNSTHCFLCSTCYRDKHTSEKASKGSAGVEELARIECSLGEMSIGEEEHLDEQAINDLRNSTIDWAVNPPPVKASDRDDEEQDSSDEEYIPPLSLRFGGALPNVPNFDALPIIGLEETVHELTEDFESEPSTDPDSSTASPADSNMPTVQKAEDIVGGKASIVYDDCLKYLAAFVTPPVKHCTAKNVTGATCQRHPPFLVNIKGKGTASVLEWSCAKGHIVWRWVSQPLMKYGLQSGDFMLSTNILLSGNNYAKIALLFRFMNMGIVDPNTFLSIQDTYCVDSIKKYWMEKSADVIARLQDKDVVVLG